MNSSVNNFKTEPSEVLDGARDVVADIDQFLSTWLDRFDRHAERTELTAIPDEHLQRRIRELQWEQRQWETQRKTQQQVLDAKAKQLTDAWLRLESEQRMLLQSGKRETPIERIPIREDKAPDEPNQCRQNSILQNPIREGGAPSEPNETPIGPSLALPIKPPRDVIPRDAAVLQFEKLKQEIESTRRQLSKSSS